MWALAAARSAVILGNPCSGCSSTPHGLAPSAPMGAAQAALEVGHAPTTVACPSGRTQAPQRNPQRTPSGGRLPHAPSVPMGGFRTARRRQEPVPGTEGWRRGLMVLSTPTGKEARPTTVTAPRAPTYPRPGCQRMPTRRVESGSAGAVSAGPGTSARRSTRPPTPTSRATSGSARPASDGPGTSACRSTRPQTPTPRATSGSVRLDSERSAISACQSTHPRTRTHPATSGTARRAISGSPTSASRSSALGLTTFLARWG